MTGDHLCLATDGGGLRIVDVSSPSSPFFVGHLATMGQAFDVATAGDLAYVVDNALGLLIVDIGDPSMPRPLGAVDVYGLSRAVALSDDIVGVAANFGGLSLILPQCAAVSDVPENTPEAKETALPRLSQNFPNPFNPMTTIEFQLPVPGRVTLAVHDAAGRRITTLIQAQDLTEGRHEVQWHGTDQAGRKAASGVYFFRLSAGNNVVTMRAVLIK